MRKEDCFYLGKVLKTHGFKGDLSFRLDVDFPKNYSKLGSVFVDINNELVPFFIEEIDVRDKGIARVRLEDIRSEGRAGILVGKSLYLPTELLPELKGNQFYYHEVIGFQVIDKVHGELGTIKEVLEYPHQAVFSIYKNETEILVPVSRKIIKNVDRDKKEIQVETPEGLIDVYLKK